MKLPQLTVLVVDISLKLNDFSSPSRTLKKIKDLDGYDLVIVPISANMIDVYLLETSNTLSKHDGNWREIMFMQEEVYKYESQKFSYFNITDMTPEIMVNNLRQYFNLTIIRNKL